MKKKKTVADTVVEDHLRMRRPSIERIVILGQECLEHDASWYEFKTRCEEILKREDKMIKLLSERLP